MAKKNAEEIVKETMVVLKENNSIINNNNNNNKEFVNSAAEAAVVAAAAADSSSSTTCGVLNDNDNHHPYAFHVSGPRNVSSPNWREIIKSSWYIFYLLPHFFDFLFILLYKLKCPFNLFEL